MQIRVVPGVCWERINLSQALSPSPGSKLFYIYTKKVLSPIEPGPGQPVTLPLREEVPWNRRRTPLGAPCPDKAGLGRASGAVTGAKLGCPGWFCPPRHPHRPSYRLERVTFFGPAESSQPYPLRQKSPCLSLAFVGGFFCQRSFGVFLIITERGFFPLFHFWC